jgi:hypothetical protein
MDPRDWMARERCLPGNKTLGSSNGGFAISRASIIFALNAI